MYHHFLGSKLQSGIVSAMVCCICGPLPGQLAHHNSSIYYWGPRTASRSPTCHTLHYLHVCSCFHFWFYLNTFMSWKIVKTAVTARKTGHGTSSVAACKVRWPMWCGHSRKVRAGITKIMTQPQDPRIIGSGLRRNNFPINFKWYNFQVVQQHGFYSTTMFITSFFPRYFPNLHTFLLCVHTDPYSPRFLPENSQWLGWEGVSGFHWFLMFSQFLWKFGGCGLYVGMSEAGDLVLWLRMLPTLFFWGTPGFSTYPCNNLSAGENRRSCTQLGSLRVFSQTFAYCAPFLPHFFF